MQGLEAARLCESALAIAHGLVPGRHHKEQAQLPHAQLFQYRPAQPQLVCSQLIFSSVKHSKCTANYVHKKG